MKKYEVRYQRHMEVFLVEESDEVQALSRARVLLKERIGTAYLSDDWQLLDFSESVYNPEI